MKTLRRHLLRFLNTLQNFRTSFRGCIRKSNFKKINFYLLAQLFAIQSLYPMGVKAANGPAPGTRFSSSPTPNHAPPNNSSAGITDTETPWITRLQKLGQDQNQAMFGFQTIQDLVTPLEGAGSGTNGPAPGTTSDEFHLASQSVVITDLETGTSKTYNLLTDQPPKVPIQRNSFYRDIKIKLNPEDQTLRLVYEYESGDYTSRQKWIDNLKAGLGPSLLKKRMRAEHIIGNINGAVSAGDQELISVVTNDGRILVMDAITAKFESFSSVLPLIDVGSIPKLATGARLESAAYFNDGLSYPLHPQAKFPLEEGARGAFRFGHLTVMVRDQNGVSIAGIFDRDVIRTHLHVVQGALSRLGSLILPSSKTFQILQESNKLFAASSEYQQFLENRKDNVDPLTAAALQTLPPPVIAAMMARASGNLTPGARTKMNQQMARILGGQRPDAYQKLSEEGKTARVQKSLKIHGVDRVYGQTFDDGLAEGNLSSFQNEIHSPKFEPLIERLAYHVQGNKFRYLGLVTAGLLGFVGISTLGHGIGPQWAVHLFNRAYSVIKSDVFSDPGYAYGALAFSVSTLMLIPNLLLVLGGFVHKAAFGTFEAARGFVYSGMKAFGYVSLFFWFHLANVFRMTNMIYAAQRGLRPYWGKALNWPLVTSAAKIESNRQALQEKYVDKKKVESLALLISLLVVSQQDGNQAIDLGLMLTLIKKGDLDKKTIEVAYQDPHFFEDVSRTTHETTLTLASLVSMDSTDSGKLGERFKNIDRKFLDEAVTIAQAKYQSIQKIRNDSPAMAKFFDRARYMASLARHRFWSTVGNLGLENNRILNETAPDASTVRITVSQYYLDVMEYVPQSALFGPKADPSNPYNYFADPDGLLWTRDNQFYDYFQLTAVYGLGLSGQNVLALMEASRNRTDPNYGSPSQATIHQRDSDVEDGYVSGLSGILGKALNFKERKYFDYWQRVNSAFFKGIQFSLIYMVAGRTVFANMSVGLAAMTGLAHRFMNNTALAFFWNFANKGTKAYLDTMNEKRQTLIDLKTQLDEAIRLHDFPGISTSFEKILQVYAEADKTIRPALRDRMQESNAILADPSGKGLQRISALFSSFWEQAFNSFAAYDIFYRKNRQQLFEIQAQMELAVRSGNKVEILRGFQTLLNLYGQNGDPVPQELSERISAARQIINSPPGENFEKLLHFADEFTPERLMSTANEAYDWMQSKPNSPFPTKPNALVDITTTQATILWTNFLGTFTSLIAFGRLKIDVLGVHVDLPKAFAENPYVTALELLGVSAVMLVSLGAVYKGLEKGQALAQKTIGETERLLQNIREAWEKSQPDTITAGSASGDRKSLVGRIVTSCRKLKSHN